MIQRDALTRRDFVRLAASVTTFGVASGGSGGGLSSPLARVHETRVISTTPHLYCGWPTVTRRRSGQLILVWSGGRERHVCPFGRVDMMRSDDEGRTWSWPRTLLDSAIDDRDAGVVETDRGTLLVTTFTSLAYQTVLERALAKEPGSFSGSELERWLRVHHRLSSSQRRAELGQWMIRSTDGGLSWSRRYPSLVNSPHGPIQLSDGRLIYAGVRLWDERRDVGVCESRDDGQSWQWLSEIPTRAGDHGQDYHELHAVEAREGRILVHIRNHNRSEHRETLQCESHDGGRSWTMPHSIGVWGLPSFLLRLSDGRLLMTYGYRREPFGNMARLSHDQGATWGPPLTISSDGSGVDLGYPSTVELTDKTLLTVWYEKMEGSRYAVLRQARWSIGE